MKQSIWFVSLLVLVISINVSWAQSTWDGPTGAYLNPLAINLEKGQGQAHIHYLDLQPAGTLTTYGASYGLTERFELGLTQANLSLGGTQKVDVLHAKYLLQPLGSGKPGVALGGLLRHAHGGSNTQDIYLVGTHVFPASKPVIASVTVRNTNGLGSGLFGKDTRRSTQFGGFLGVQVGKFIPNVEYYEQPGGKAWKDVGVRYVANANTIWDFGIADVANGLEEQFALGVTHKF